MSVKGQWLGKYRAKVLSIDDPDRQGRIKVSCPRVLGEYESAWCLPCIPNALDSIGDYFLPAVGEGVWVEFEEGDANKPIWTGGWYSQQKIPINSGEPLDRKRVIAYNGSKIEISKDSITLTVGGKTLNLTGTTINTLNYLIENAYRFRRN